MSDAKFGSWSVAESEIVIEYSLVAIEEIRHEVAEGLQRLSRGGVEVGGALYGTRDGRTVSVLAMRPIACEHARGPAFLLSDKDKELLREQLKSEMTNPRLEGMICVGWFLSHTRSEVMLSESDLEIYSQFFGAPWQVTLVIRPGRGGSMRAGFFVREQDGSVKSERSYLEFNFPDRLAGVLDRPPRSDRIPGERRPGPSVRQENGSAAASFQREIPREMPRSVHLPLTGPELLPPPPRKAKWPLLAVWAILAIALVAAGFRYFVQSPRADPIALTVTEKDGQLQISWNHLSRSVTGASRGSLAIVDGTQTRTETLTPQDLARGNFTYVRNSGDVEVRMAVENPSGDKVEEASRFLGRPPVTPDSEELKSLQQQRDDLQAQLQRLRQENAAQNERIQQLERTLRILQTRLGAK